MTHLLTVRDVRRARAFYADVFGEIRCSMRDPDGYLIEVGQATGLVEGRLAEQAPAGRQAGRADGR